MTGATIAWLPPGVSVKARTRDLTGRRFTCLVALRVVGKHINGSLLWLCECDCGKQKNVPSCRLTTGKVHSCGCYRSKIKSEWHKTHTTWNKGKTYTTKRIDEVFASKNAWTEAVKRHCGDICQRCGWHEAPCDVHHLVKKSLGGKNVISNGIVLCPNCHRIEHHQRLI